MFGLRIDRQSRVIIAAYAVFCAGLLLTSLFVTRQVRQILASTEKLYVHPFTVSNQALEARLAIMSIRRDILLAVLSKDVQQVRQTQDQMAAKDARIEESMSQVRAFYLGDAAEVERASRLYAAWKPVRSTILDAARRGDFDRARVLVLSSGTPMYNEINEELNKIIAFARNRAAQFVEEARSQREHAERLILLVMFGGFAASFLCSALVIRSVRKIVRGHEQNLVYMAHHDPLTGLPNRQLFMDRIRQALLLAEREQKDTGLLYVDLDRFKEINDTFGHDAGDAMLIQVAAGLAASVRSSDTVARLGGDEFVVLLQDVKGREALRDVAQKILTMAATPCIFQGHSLEVSASVGIAVASVDGREVETLLVHADAAMYRAKNAGRNQFAFYAQEEPA